MQLWLPETPRWLLLAGAPKEEAEKAVSRAWGKGGGDPQAVRREVETMQRDSTPNTSETYSATPKCSINFFFVCTATDLGLLFKQPKREASADMSV